MEDTHAEVLVINVSGVRFETYKSTIQKHTNSNLTDDNWLQRHFRQKEEDYFFDRDPDVFKAVLNYNRTGELHIPSCVCGIVAEQELKFWGIGKNIIENCCWGNYKSFRLLHRYFCQEDGQEDDFIDDKDTDSRIPTGFMRTMICLRNNLNYPSYSISAKVYGCISLLFAILSVSVLIAEFHFQHYDKFNETDDVIIKNATMKKNHSLSDIPYDRPKIADLTILVRNCCCTMFFVTEYSVKLFLSPKKLSFVFCLKNLNDLAAIMSAIEPSAEIQIFWIARILRLHRLIYFLPSFRILVYALGASYFDLLTMILFVLINVLIYSTTIYDVEFKHSQEECNSIYCAMLWAVITMTTVGYGDITPVSTAGRLIAALASLTGLVIIAITVSAVVGNFVLFKRIQQYTNDKKETKIHPCQSDDKHQRDADPESIPLAGPNDDRVVTVATAD